MSIFLCRRTIAAAILDAILNFTVTVAYWKGRPPEVVAGGMGSPTIQPVSYTHLTLPTILRV